MQVLGRATRPFQDRKVLQVHDKTPISTSDSSSKVVVLTLWRSNLKGVMAATSGINSYSGVNEKDGNIRRSSSENSEKAAKKGVYDDKAALPVNMQEPNLSDGASSDSIQEVFDIEAIDPVLSKKMALVNTAIDEIGMTSFQWKMFFLNGFGYAVDSVS